MRSFLLLSLFFTFFNSNISIAMNKELLSYQIYKNAIENIKAAPNNQKKKFRIKALQILLDLADQKDPRAMSHFDDPIEIENLIKMIDPSAFKDNDKKIIFPIQNAIDNNNSWAAFIAFKIYEKREYFLTLKNANNPAFLNYEAKVLEKQGKLKEALEKLRQAEAQNYLPAIKQKAVLLGGSNNEEDIKEAIVIYRKLIKEWSDIWAKGSLGNVLKIYRKYEETKDEYKYWLEEASKDSDSLAKIILAIVAAEENKIVYAKTLLMEADPLIKKMSRFESDAKELLRELYDYAWKEIKNAERGISLNAKQTPEENNKQPFSKAIEFANSMSDQENLEAFLTASKELPNNDLKANRNTKYGNFHPKEELKILYRAQSKYEKFLDELDQLRNNMNEQIPKTKKFSQKKYEKPHRMPYTKKEVVSKTPAIAENSVDQETIIPLINDSTDDGNIEEIHEKINETPTVEKIIITVPVDEKVDEKVEESFVTPDYCYQKFETNKQPSAKREAQEKDTEDKEFLSRIANQLEKVQHLVIKLLSPGGKIKDKEVRQILNKLQTKRPENVRGSHNKVQVSLDKNNSVPATLIKSHHGTSPRANSDSLKDIFHRYEIRSANQLWPSLKL